MPNPPCVDVLNCLASIPAFFSGWRQIQVVETHFVEVLRNIRIAEPIRNGKEINLYEYNLEETFHFRDLKMRRMDLLKREWKKWAKTNLLNSAGVFELGPNKMLSFVTKLYEKAYNALDIIKLIEDGFMDLGLEKRYELLIMFNKVKKEFRNEKMLLLFVVHFITGAKATDE